jgi:hypothetical protein
MENLNREDSTSQETTTDTKPLPSLDELRASEERYYAKKNGTDQVKAEPSEAGKEYLRRLAEKEKRQPLTIASLMGDFDRKKQKRVFHPYPFQPMELLPLAKEIYTARLASVGRAPIWDGPTEKVFQDLVRYFSGDELGPLDVHRGIYLFGGVGAGKSILMQTFMEFTALIEKRLKDEQMYTPRHFRLSVCRDISTEIQAASKADLRQYFGGIRVFDDLGNEEDKKVYGNEIQPMVDIILHRYNLYQTAGLITHATSNLAPHECQTVYGDRIGSRVFEMFNLVLLDTKDKRKP